MQRKKKCEQNYEQKVNNNKTNYLIKMPGKNCEKNVNKIKTISIILNCKIK